MKKDTAPALRERIILSWGVGQLASWFDRFRRRAPAAAPVRLPLPVPLPAGNSAVSFFRLQTSQGQIVSVDDDARLVRLPTLDPARALLALAPQAKPDICLLVAPDARRLAIPGDVMAGIAISARIMRTTQRGTVRFKQPIGGMWFLTADESAPGEAPADLRFDGPGTTMEAAFTLLPVTGFEIPAAANALGGPLGALAAAGFRLAALLVQARAGGLPAELAEAVLRLLPRDELDDLAQLLLEEPETQALVQKLLPQDSFVQTHLPALVAWRQSRTPTATDGQLVSPAADEKRILPSVNLTGVPLGHALHSLARGHVTPRRDFCVLAAARNEGPYLLDWLAYHLSIGFEHVFLYTNDNTDGSDTLLAPLARAGIITWVHNTRGEKIGVQEKGYAHALTLLPDILDYRWTAVLDLDEYFCFAPGMFDNVADFMALHEAQPVDAVALNWLIFASRVGDPYADTPTTQRFIWRSHDVNVHVKSIFRTRQFWHSQPHYPYPTLSGPFIYRSQDGGFHHHPGVQDRIPAFSANPAAEQGWVNHYLLRTAPEALWKLARGSAAWAQGEDERERPAFADFITRTFLDLARPETQVTDRRIEGCAKGQAAMHARLCALPGVAEANEAIKRDFAEKLKALAERFLAAAPPRDASVMQLRFRDAVAASLGMRRKAPMISSAPSRMV